MDFYNTGLKFDIENDYINAVTFYEKSIASNEKNKDSYINLAFIYWQSAAKFTWADYYNIPEAIRHKGSRKFKEIISVAIDKFPNDVELHFWEKYFPHRFINEPLTQQDVLRIVWNNSVKSLVPYFFLYLFDRKLYKKERDRLMEICMGEKTAKNIYIFTILK